MNEAERALLTERQAAEIDARVVFVDGGNAVVDQKVISDVTDLDALVSIATGPNSRKRKVSRCVSSSKQLFLSSDHISKKKQLVDSICRVSFYLGYVDREPAIEDSCSLQEAEEMKLALERSEKETIRSLDDGKKRLHLAYGGPDAANCFNKDPRDIDDKMLQLVVVQSKELSSHDQVSEMWSLRSLSPSIDDGVDISPFIACLGSFVLVGTATRSASAKVAQRDGEDGFLAVHFFPTVGGGSSRISDPCVLHSRISWKEHTSD